MTVEIMRATDGAGAVRIIAIQSRFRWYGSSDGQATAAGAGAGTFQIDGSFDKINWFSLYNSTSPTRMYMYPFIRATKGDATPVQFWIDAEATLVSETP